MWVTYNGNLPCTNCLLGTMDGGRGELPLLCCCQLSIWPKYGWILGATCAQDVSASVTQPVARGLSAEGSILCEL